nr:hypothetical protein [Clostridioides sp.]
MELNIDISLSDCWGSVKSNFDEFKILVDKPNKEANDCLNMSKQIRNIKIKMDTLIENMQKEMELGLEEYMSNNPGIYETEEM